MVSRSSLRGCPGPTPAGAVFLGNLGLQANSRAGSAAPPAGGFAYGPSPGSPAVSCRGLGATIHLQDHLCQGRQGLVTLHLSCGHKIYRSNRSQGTVSFLCCHHRHTGQPSQANPRPLAQSKFSAASLLCIGLTGLPSSPLLTSMPGPQSLG